MSFSEDFNDTRLVCDKKIPKGHGETIYNHALKSILLAYNVDVDIHDTYSAEKSPEIFVYEGKQYLVMDHALSEYFNLLNALVSIEEAPDFILAILQRPLAEICRRHGHLKHYAFFIMRSFEVKPFVRLLSQSGSHSLQIFWQTMTILAHESAHCIPKDCKLGEHLYFGSRIFISMEVNRIIEETNSKLMSAIMGEEIDDEYLTQNDLFELLNSIDNHENNLQEAFLAKTNDETFVEEIVCDSFSAHAIKSHLCECIELQPDETNQDSVEGILLAAHNTFLNMRFHQYTEDIAKLIGMDTPEKINPLRLDGLVEFTIRGNLFAKNIFSIWNDLFSGSEATDTLSSFEKKIRHSTQNHTNKLFIPFNAFIEETLLNESFAQKIDDCLIEDGFELDLFEATPWKARKLFDGFWNVIVD